MGSKFWAFFAVAKTRCENNLKLPAFCGFVKVYRWPAKYCIGSQKTYFRGVTAPHCTTPLPSTTRDHTLPHSPLLLTALPASMISTVRTPLYWPAVMHCTPLHYSSPLYNTWSYPATLPSTAHCSTYFNDIYCMCSTVLTSYYLMHPTALLLSPLQHLIIPCHTRLYCSLLYLLQWYLLYVLHCTDQL